MPDPSILYLDRKVEIAVKLFDKGVPINEWPDDLKEVFERWGVAHQLKLKYHFKGDDFVREIHKLRFHLNDTTARQDLRCAEMFYGKTKQPRRNYERIIRLEFLKKASYEAFSVGKYKEVAALEAIIQKYLDPAHDPIDMPDWDELRKAVQPVIEFNPELRGVERLTSEEVQKLWNSVQRRKNLDISDAEIIDEPKKSCINKIDETNA